MLFRTTRRADEYGIERPDRQIGQGPSAKNELVDDRPHYEADPCMENSSTNGFNLDVPLFVSG